MSIVGKHLIILIDQPQRMSLTKYLPVECVVHGTPRTSAKIKKLLVLIVEKESWKERQNRMMGESKRKKMEG